MKAAWDGAWRRPAWLIPAWTPSPGEDGQGRGAAEAAGAVGPSWGAERGSRSGEHNWRGLMIPSSRLLFSSHVPLHFYTGSPGQCGHLGATRILK